MTPVASIGPSFETVNVKVTVSPTFGVASLTVLVILKSAYASTKTVKEQESVLPQSSVAVQVTVVSPLLKETPFNVSTPEEIVAPVSSYDKLSALSQLSVAVASQLVPE